MNKQVRMYIVMFEYVCRTVHDVICHVMLSCIDQRIIDSKAVEVISNHLMKKFDPGTIFKKVS